VLYLTIQNLKAWGATVTLDNVQGDPNAVRAVLSGQADVAMRSSAAPNISSGLYAFGPSHPHVDYFMVAAKNITSIDQLPGHKFAVSNTGGIEATMYHAEMALHKIPEDKVPLTISGSAAARVDAMLAGRIDATFAHADGWLTLKEKGYNSIATVAKDLPDLAAGYFSGKLSWIQANPDLVVAIDMAWLKAAHVFQTDPKAYLTAAQEYTSRAHDDSYVDQYYKIAKAANIWPDDGTGFSDEVLNYNAKNAFNTKATDKDAALQDWTVTTGWKQAIKNVLHK
jgi:ABC-type nitrate/sulfonate/bicarbonate transport system substrate-binding protein